MNIGLPGTGIGGLFYITAALFAPFKKGAKTGRTGALRPMVIALGVLAGIFATGWLLGFMLGPAAHTPVSTNPAIFGHPRVVNVVRWAALLGSVILLGAVLAAVQIARLVQRRYRKHETN